MRTVIVIGVAAGCGGVSAAPAKEFNGQQAYQYAATQVAFGPRIPGTPGHAAEERWLDSLARARADTVVLQQWWHHTQHGDSIQMTNVIARFNPKATKRILYLAHWDTRPHADGPDSKDKQAPVPGANDGASGVAILLGVMDALHRQPPTIGVDLLFDDGEDFDAFSGAMSDVLIGATYYANHPLPGPQPEFAVLFDMVGDKDLRIPIEPLSQIAAPNVIDLIWSVADQLGYGHIFVREPQGAITDDDTPLINAGIKAVDLIDFTYPPWHTPEDTMDKISAASLDAVGNVAVAVIRREQK